MCTQTVDSQSNYTLLGSYLEKSQSANSSANCWIAHNALGYRTPIERTVLSVIAQVVGSAGVIPETCKYRNTVSMQMVRRPA
jgi:hypothetical protein